MEMWHANGILLGFHGVFSMFCFFFYNRANHAMGSKSLGPLATSIHGVPTFDDTVTGT